MITVKFLVDKRNRSASVKKTIGNILNYFKIKIGKTSIISDSSSIELSSGRCTNNDSDFVVEILIKKRLFINKKDLDDKLKLDKFINEIKTICDKSKEISQFKYIPISFRDKSDNN